MHSITRKIKIKTGGQNSQSEVGARIQSNRTLTLSSAGPGMSLAIDQTAAFNGQNRWCRSTIRREDVDFFCKYE